MKEVRGGLTVLLFVTEKMACKFESETCSPTMSLSFGGDVG